MFRSQCCDKQNKNIKSHLFLNYFLFRLLFLKNYFFYFQCDSKKITNISEFFTSEMKTIKNCNSFFLVMKRKRVFSVLFDCVVKMLRVKVSSKIKQTRP